MPDDSFHALYGRLSLRIYQYYSTTVRPTYSRRNLSGPRARQRDGPADRSSVSSRKPSTFLASFGARATLPIIWVAGAERSPSVETAAKQLHGVPPCPSCLVESMGASLLGTSGTYKVHGCYALSVSLSYWVVNRTVGARGVLCSRRIEWQKLEQLEI